MSERLLENKVLQTCDDCVYSDCMLDPDTGDLIYMCLHSDAKHKFIEEKVNENNQLIIPEWCPLPKLG